MSVLLTGATGFLGIHLLSELLDRTHGMIYCLVRPTSDTRQIQQITQNHWHENGSKRVILVHGDLTQPNLGVANACYARLLDVIDTVFHAGAVVQSRPFAELKPANIDGTAEIMRFCTRGRQKQLHFISSLSLFFSPNYAGMIVDEQTPLLNSAECYPNYPRTKWQAEKMLRDEQMNGLHTVVYRPTILTGNSRSADYKLNNFYLGIRAVRHLGLYPSINEYVNFLPVDVAARLIVHLSEQTESANRALNICHSESISWQNLFQLLGTSRDLAAVSPERWFWELDNCLQTERAVDLYPFRQTLQRRLSILFSVRPRYDTRYLRDSWAKIDTYYPNYADLLALYFPKS